MTPQEIRDAIAAAPALLALVPDTVAISAAMQSASSRPLAVEDVFDSLYTTGDYSTLKAAQLAGSPLAVAAFETLRDAKTIGPGKVNLALPATVDLLDQLQAAGLLTQAGRDALTARAATVTGPSEFEVRCAIFADDGSLLV
jgi:hypothetical protein